MSREMLKATKVDVLKNKIKEEDDILGSFSSTKSNYFKLADGSNKFRLFPKHPNDGENDAFYHLKAINWGTIMDEENKEQRRTVFNSKIHGGAKLDMIEEFVKEVNKKCKDSEESEHVNAIKAVNGFGKDSGMKLQSTWVAYANQIKKVNGEVTKTFGMLDMKRSVKDALMASAVTEDIDDEIEDDPYTDPDTGKAVTIKYNSNAKKAADYYTVVVNNPMALTDEEVEHFINEVKPLSDIFKNCFSLSDFDLQVDMCKFIDDKFELGIFEDDDFIELVETIKAQFSEKQEKTAKAAEIKTVKKPDTKKKSAAKVDEEDDDEDDEDNDDEEEQDGVPADEFEGMDRKEMKKWITAEKEKSPKAEFMKVTTSKTDEDVREMIRKYVSTKKEVVGSKSVTSKISTKAKPEKSSLADVKNRLKGITAKDDEDDD